jgi:hypothetical protein
MNYWRGESLSLCRDGGKLFIQMEENSKWAENGAKGACVYVLAVMGTI